MKKPIAVIAVLLAVTVIVWHYATREAPAPKSADLLPDTTLLFVNMPDFPKSRDEFRQTQLCALWQEPEVQAFLEKPRLALREALGTGSPRSPRSERGKERSKSDSALNELLEERVVGLLQGEVFVAVTHLSPPPIVQAGVVFGADVKQKRLEAQAYLKLVEHDLARNFPKATATDKSYLGKTYTIWQLRENQQVCHAFLNSLLVCTLDENPMRDIITRFAGQAPADSKTLAASPKFQSLLQHTPASRAAVAYLNVEQVLGIVAPFLALSPQAGGMFQKLSAIQASATSITFGDGLIEDVSLVAYAGKHSATPALERHTLALTSPDTSLYAVRATDLAASYRGVMDTIAQSGNATLTAAASQFERGLNQRGLRLADDVLANLGPELAFIGVWHEGANLPDVALVAEVKNVAPLRPKIDHAMEALNDAGAGLSEAQPHLGETLHTWHAGGSVSPSYVVTDKFLILASNADYARALIAQSKNPAPTLAGNADFSKALQRVPAQASSLSYCDLRRVFDALYTLARANAQSNQYVDLGKLPKVETITKHLAPFVSATVDAADLQTTTTFSPFGKPLTLVIGAAGALGAAQPFLAKFVPSFIPTWPTMSSSTAAPPPPRGNQTATSQTPATP